MKMMDMMKKKKVLLAKEVMHFDDDILSMLAAGEIKKTKVVRVRASYAALYDDNIQSMLAAKEVTDNEWLCVYKHKINLKNFRRQIK